MDQYLIAMGSNLGDRESYIQRALDEMAKFAAILNIASTIETLPIGPGDRRYLNSACTIACLLQPLELLSNTQAIEQKLGRVASVRWGNRVIDLDIILWQPELGKFAPFKCENLEIPHPQCHLRDFVLQPAAEIAGDWHHPIQHQFLNELYEKFI